MISYIFLALCVVLWAFIPVASKKILKELDNIQMLFYSTIFSFITMLFVLFIQDKLKVFKMYSPKDYIIMVLMGFLGAYIYYIILYKAFSLTTAQEAYLIIYIWPILLLLLSFIFLKEQITWRKIVAVIISFLGIFIIITKGKVHSFSFTNIKGNLLALIGAFVWASFSLTGKKYNFDRTVSVFIFFFTALILVFFTIIFKGSLKIPSFKVFSWLLFNGILINGISYIFWLKALEIKNTGIISTSIYLTPFISLIYIKLFLNEKIMLSSLLGLLMVTAGIALQFFDRKSQVKIAC